MKLHAFSLITALLFVFVIQINAQTKTALPDTSLASGNGETEQARNFTKLNITALALKTYAVQYERVLSRKISVSLSFKVMPGTTLPFKNLVINMAGQNDPNIIRTIENLRLSHFAITPELRFYTGKKGYGRGFYIAPFYRYAGFKTNELAITYEDGAHAENSIKLGGKLTTHTGGILLGAQWTLGKHFCLDWWIAGPQYGTGNGYFTGLAGKTLSSSEQQNLQKELDNLDFPLIKKTVAVNKDGASLKLNGPWAGVRAGLCLGIKY